MDAFRIFDTNSQGFITL